MRILIADDDLSTQEIVAGLLEIWGHEPVVAVDGEEAWACLQEDDAPSLVILDWMMPPPDGLEVCRRLRERGGWDPAYVILLSGRGEQADVVLGLDAGADDYITKPFEEAELRSRIAVGQRVLRLQHALAGQVRDLQAALEHVKTLQGLIPICMYCHKIRNDRESWERIEDYIAAHSEATFTHGLCPDCYAQERARAGLGPVGEDSSKGVKRG